MEVLNYLVIYYIFILVYYILNHLYENEIASMECKIHFQYCFRTRKRYILIIISAK